MGSLPGFEVKDAYALFRPSGRASVESFLALIESAVRACQSEGVTKMLLDARKLEHPPLTTHQIFAFATGLAAFWDRRIRLAIVSRPDQMDPERFGRLVAGNRGLHFSSHLDEADALRDLLRPDSEE
jgi:hypothetical protein